MAADSDFNDVILLLHCDDAGGSPTTFTDNSLTGHTITTGGNATQSSAQSKWGGSSGLFDGTGDYLTIPAHADFNFAGNDFTIEGWLYPVAEGGNSISLVNCQSSTNYFALQTVDSTSSYTNLFYSNTNIISGIVVPFNVWSHVAIVRTTTDLKVYVDGVQSGSTYTIGVNTVDLSSSLGVGGNVSQSAQSFDGYLDDIRYTKDVARYTGTFTPPTEAFADSLTEPSVPIGPEVMVINGNTPTLTVGVVVEDTVVTEMAMTMTGGTPVYSGDVVKELVVSIGGQTPVTTLETVVTPNISGQRFICTITGSADALPDVVIPISNLTSRIGSGGISTKTVVVSSGVDYADIISNRPNGGIVIENIQLYDNGTQASFTDVEYAIDTIRSDQGAINYSVTIVANKDLPTQPSVVRELKGVSIINQQANGTTRVRCDVNQSMFPDDVAVMPDSTRLIVNNITTVVSSNGLAYMEVVSG